MVHNSQELLPSQVPAYLAPSGQRTMTILEMTLSHQQLHILRKPNRFRPSRLVRFQQLPTLSHMGIITHLRPKCWIRTWTKTITIILTPVETPTALVLLAQHWPAPGTRMIRRVGQRHQRQAHTSRIS